MFLRAKLRISEQKAKFIWAFSSESNFDEVKVTKNFKQISKLNIDF